MIFAGGNGTRLGLGKACLRWQERPLLPTLVAELGRQFPEVLFAVGRRRAFPFLAGGREVEDLVSGKGPLSGRAEATPGRDGYSWVKSPRDGGEPFEVGPAAQARVGLGQGDATFRETPVIFSAKPGRTPTTSLRWRGATWPGRSRLAIFLASSMNGSMPWIWGGGPIAAPFGIPDEVEGCGLTCAPRGALGHWVRIVDGKIRNYQVIALTTWNASPRDGHGVPGPIERALVGMPVKEDGLVEAERIVRSFDPCLACAVQ